MLINKLEFYCNRESGQEGKRNCFLYSSRLKHISIVPVHTSELVCFEHIQAIVQKCTPDVDFMTELSVPNVKCCGL